jgi:glycosyltransferase involved in cell wall biosynthesis
VSKIRVLYDATLARNPAGTGTYVRGLLAALQRRSDLELTTATMDSGSVQTLDTGRKPAGSRVVNSLHHLAYYLDRLPRQARATRSDLIFCPSSLVPLRGSTPFAMTVYDLTARRYPQTLDPFSRVYGAAMLRRGLRRARAVCTISQSVAGEIAAEPDRAGQPIHVAYPGANPDLLAATPEPVAIAGSPFLLMVGTLEPRKNQVTALRAFAEYRETHPDSELELVLAGSPGWRYGDVLQTIEALRLERHVRRVGSVRAGQLKWLYQHARALLFPSLYEGFGLPVLEAFVLRCPVVAADIPPVREITGPDTATLLDPLTVSPWTHAIARIASEPADAARLESAFARAGAFTWDRCAAAVVEAMLDAAPRAVA